MEVQKLVTKNLPLIYTSIGHFANDGTVFLVPVIVDIVANLEGVDHITITLALSLFYLSTAVSANIFSPYIDKQNAPVKGMFVGILILAVGLIMFAVTFVGYQVSFFVIASSVVTGIGASFYHPTGSAILQLYYKRNRLGRYLGLNGSAGSLGRAVYPILLSIMSIILVSQIGDIVFVGVLDFAISFIILFGFMGHRERYYPPVSIIKDTVETVQSTEVIESNEIRNKKSIKILTVLSFLRNLAFTGVIAWIPEFVSFERGAGISISLGTTMTIMFSGGILGQSLFGRLAENHDKRMILMLSTISASILMFMYIYLTGTESLIFLLFFGLASFSGFPVVMAMIAEYFPKGSNTSNNALVWNLGGAGGRTVGPLIVGAIIGATYSKLSFAFEILLIIGVCSALMATLLPKPSK